MIRFRVWGLGGFIPKALEQSIMLFMRHDIAELEARLLLTIPGLYIHRMAVRIEAKAPRTLNSKP